MANIKRDSSKARPWSPTEPLSEVGLSWPDSFHQALNQALCPRAVFGVGGAGVLPGIIKRDTLKRLLNPFCYTLMKTSVCDP